MKQVVIFFSFNMVFKYYKKNQRMSEKETRFCAWYCNLIFHMSPQLDPDTVSRPKADAWNCTCDNALGQSC